MSGSGRPAVCSDREEGLGEGQGVWPEGIAGLEQPGGARMVFQDRAQAVREDLDVLGPGTGVIDIAVDLGQNRVEDEVVELLLVAHVAVQRAGNHSQTRGEGAHAERIHAVGADDREGLGDDPLAGQRASGALVLDDRGDEPEPLRVRLRGGRLWSLGHVLPPRLQLTVNSVHARVNSVARKRAPFTETHSSGVVGPPARPAAKGEDMTVMTGWDLFEDLREVQEQVLRMNRLRAPDARSAGPAI